MDAAFTGNDWSFYPSHNRIGGLNIVSGRSAIASRILHILLTRKGEDPIHPSLGIAPELFQPLSQYDPRYFVYQADQEIRNWNNRAKIGIGALSVDVVVYEDRYTNGIGIEIQFSPANELLVSSLSFGFWEYLGATHSRSFEEFLDGVELDGDRFKLLTDNWR
jgi:hypothetical protein